MRRNNEKYKVLDANQLLAVWGSLLIGVVVGGVYAISVRGNNLLFFTLHEYITSGYAMVPRIEVIKTAAIQYSQLFLIIAILEYSHYTRLLLWICMGLLGVAYGFTASSFGVIFGGSGILFALFEFGVQGLVLIGAIAYIVLEREKLDKELNKFKLYTKIVLKVMIILNVIVIMYMNLYLLYVK